MRPLNMNFGEVIGITNMCKRKVSSKLCKIYAHVHKDIVGMTSDCNDNLYRIEEAFFLFL